MHGCQEEQKLPTAWDIRPNRNVIFDLWEYGSETRTMWNSVDDNGLLWKLYSHQARLSGKDSCLSLYPGQFEQTCSHFSKAAEELNFLPFSRQLWLLLSEFVPAKCQLKNWYRRKLAWYYIVESDLTLISNKKSKLILKRGSCNNGKTKSKDCNIIACFVYMTW